jgi:hypothetical protein
MQRTLLIIFTCLLAIPTTAQQLNGQWTGSFVSANSNTEYATSYVLELEIKGKEVQGYSYTYLYILGKRCYVICRLEGSYDKGSKSLDVTEVERVKSNTPPDFKDCLQTHFLTYFKSGGVETLKGKWKSASTKDNCGEGSSEFERKTLANIITKPKEKENPIVAKTPIEKNQKVKTDKKTITQTQPSKKKITDVPVLPPVKKITPPIAKVINPIEKKPIQAAVPKRITPLVKQKTIPDTIVADKKKTIAIVSNEIPPVKSNLPPIVKKTKIDDRIKQVIKVIEVETKTFKVDLYDNGQVDGDTISLYFNGRLMVTHQRLSLVPITLTITLEDGDSDNELEMYAENLGSIPPNSALMVVTYGDKRFEINITSSEKTNGTVRFKLKE